MKAVVSIFSADNQKAFHVHMVARASLFEVGSALSKAFPAHVEVYDHGAATADFLRAVDRRSNPRLFNKLTDIREKVDRWFTISPRNGVFWVELFASEKVYGGPLSDFIPWLRAGQYEGKTVTFTYAGGTNPGKERKVAAFRSASYLKGYVEGVDIDQLELQKDDGRLVVTGGFRRYSTSKIVGEIRLAE